MVVQQHGFTAVTTEQTHTGDLNWVDITGASIASSNFTTGEKYLLYMVIKGGGTGTDRHRWRMQHGTTTFQTIIDEIPITPEARADLQFFQIWTAVASEGIKLQLKTDVAAQTVKADNVAMFSLHLGGHLVENVDWFHNVEEPNTTLSTTYSTVNNATITFTPTTAGDDWLVMCEAYIDKAGGTNQVQTRLVRSGEASDEVVEQFRFGTAYLTHQSPTKVYNLGAISNTFTTSSLASSGGGVTRFSSQVFALNLSRFKKHSFTHTAGSIGLNTTAFNTETQTTSITPSATQDIWCFGWQLMVNATDVAGWEARLQVDNVDQPATQTTDEYLMEKHPTNIGTARSSFVMQTVQNLDATSHTIAMDASEEIADVTVEERLVLALELSIDPLFNFTVNAFVTVLGQTKTFTVDAKVGQFVRQFTVDVIVRGQLAVPISDISNAGNWEDVSLGNNDTVLWDELDEIDPDDTTSAVKSTSTPETTDTFEVGLDPVSDPLKSNGHVISIRARAPVGAINQLAFNAELYEGAVLRATTPRFVLTTSFQTFTYTLTTSEADSITAYIDLRIRIIPATILQFTIDARLT